uniref:Uncharacterized protein n=1 Tax=Moniliophthora roreri TaxID=221103 RepID=A0A0W0G3A1_MONRR
MHSRCYSYLLRRKACSKEAKLEWHTNLYTKQTHHVFTIRGGRVT